MKRALVLALAAPFACAVLSGCHISTHSADGKDKVDITTPFASMKVNTNDSGDTSAIGITPYPGAKPTPDDDDKDGNSANVDMSFGSFHLGVKAASFQTSDPASKVLAFYRKDLASHFGTVIECDGHKTVGTPTSTTQGLTCSDEEQHSKINIDNASDGLELRAGSPTRQHIVSVEGHDGGTKIGLVALDLPAHTSRHGSHDSE